MNMTTRLRRLALGSAGIGVVASFLALPAAAASAADQTKYLSPMTFTTDQAGQATAVLAAEDGRLTEVRTASSLARWQGVDYQTPYRLSTGTGYTLVLTATSTPYTIDDLLALAPQTFLKMSDGAYLLSENIVVLAGAKLRLTAPGGLTLRLASSSDGFVSIVSTGGLLELVGEQDAPLEISSWDVDAAAPDENLADGRAYIRSIGGQFMSTGVAASDLGFWSGRTGGIALTGTDQPNIGAIESLADTNVTSTDVPSLLDDVSATPAGPLPDSDATPPVLGYSVPAQDYVSAEISDTTIDGNAFGLFVSGANGVKITDTTVSNSLMEGLVFHRYVTNALVSGTTAEHNAGDGISVDRASSSITITESTAKDNTGSGFKLSGRPLAEGPSAVGMSLESYGNNSVSNSTSIGNLRYGVEVLGGNNVGVQNNQIIDNEMGVMVNGPSSQISVTGNQIDGARMHGVALVNGVTESTVTGNVVDGASTGVYLRDSTGEVTGNTIKNASSHGVSLVGEIASSDVELNVLAGAGASALDTTRSTGEFTAADNQSDGWDDTTPWYYVFKKLLQPMTALWASIGILIVLSAIRAGRTRNDTIVHPYAHQMAQHGHLPMPAPTVASPATVERDDLVGAGAR